MELIENMLPAMSDLKNANKICKNNISQSSTKYRI